MQPYIENLVFSSGGIFGISFVGAYAFLVNHNLLPNVKCYSGCSAGSIFALLVNLNMTLTEIEEIVQNLDYEKFSDINFLDINTKLGFDSGKKIVDYIDDLILKKTGISNITFAGLHMLSGKKLYINAVCINDTKIEYFSVDNVPDMQVSFAVRMSISIPIIFIPVKYNNKLYVDGGMLEYIPNIFPDNSLIIKIKHICKDNNTFNLKDYCIKLYLCLFNNLQVTTKQSKYVIDIIIPDMDLLTINITDRIRKRLYKYGYRAAREYRNNHYNKIDVDGVINDGVINDGDVDDGVINDGDVDDGVINDGVINDIAK
jgi:NTE family protein